MTALGRYTGSVLVAHPLQATIERAEAHVATLAAALGLTPAGARQVRTAPGRP